MKFSEILETNTVLDYSGGCSVCPKKLINFVESDINQKHSIIFVYDSPKKKDVEEGKLLSEKNKANSFLINSLNKQGIFRKDYSVTTVTHCRTPSNKNIPDKAISCCMNQYTTKEVTGFPVVVLLGKNACSAFFPNTRFKSIKGNVLWHPDFPGQRFYAVHDPNDVFRGKNSDIQSDWLRQIKRLKNIIEWDGSCPWTTYDADHPDFLEKLDDILSNKSFCFDIETNKLESWHPDAKIISISICSSTKTALFSHEDDLVWKTVLNKIGTALQKEDKLCIGHNVGFDVDYMERKLNITSKCKLLDTQSLYYLSKQETMPSLKYLTSKYLDGYRFLITNPEKCTDITLLAKYNAEDVIRTLELAKKEFVKLSKKQKDLLLRVSSTSNLALRRITSTGFFFDLRQCRETHNKLKEERAKLVAEWKKYDEHFNEKEHLDGHGLIWYLYDHKGLPVVKRTATAQQPSTDKHTLATLRHNHDESFLQWLQRLKAIEKFENTYIEKYLNGSRVDFDYRVHSDYFNTFTKTGRASSRNPNAQNIPRDDTLAKTEIPGISAPFSIRKFFSVRDGYVLLHSDFSQIELRIGMCLALDEVGIQAYLDEGDLHWRTAKQIAAGEGREATKQDRTHAKPTNFGLLYCNRNEAYTLKKNAAQEYGIELSDKKAQEYADTFFGTYKNIPIWHKKEVQKLRANGGNVETIMGHVRTYPDYNSTDANKKHAAEREAINLACQSPAGYITLYTLYLVQQKLKENGLHDVMSVCTVHDSIMFSVPEDQVSVVIEVIEHCVLLVKEWIKHWFVVPLIIEHEVGPNWSELREI